MNCSNCKFWDLTGDRLRHNSLKYQDRPAGYGFCTISESSDVDSGMEVQSAFARDASEYAAVLITSPLFGCNQFEKCPDLDVEVRA